MHASMSASSMVSDDQISCEYRGHGHCVTILVKNHTIPQETVDRAVNTARTFFALPLDKKMSIDIHQSPNFKGYTALLGENTNPENRGDLHEGFDLGWEDLESGNSHREGDGVMTGQNVWLHDLPGFREACLEY